jgi:Cft2 family RNA processing exonuclease
MVEFIALGSTETISASCHYLNMGGTGILLDTGQDPNIDGTKGLPNYDRIKNDPDYIVDYAILTHAHHDHIGSLPVMLQKFPHARIHLTQPTRLLLDFLLPESARLQRKRFKEGTNPDPPMFNEEQAEMAGYLYRSWPLETPFELHGHRAESPIQATFYHAGHVLGAVGTLMEMERDGKTFRLFYTGDVNMRAQALQPGAVMPPPSLDVLIMESTLGADATAELTTRKIEEERFLDMIRRTLDRKGSILIPAFALGRSQEIISMLGRFKKQKKIPADLPIYTAGSQRAISDIYDRTRFISPRLDEKFEVFGIEQKRLPRSKPRINRLLEEGSNIFIVGSGMLFEKTLSNKLAQKMIEDERHSIAFVGYTKPDSPAFALLEARQQGKGSKVSLGQLHEATAVNCEVDRYRFSGHSTRRELLEIVEKTQPKKVVLVHGETEARQWMKDNILYFYPETEIVMPAEGELIEL